MICICVGHRFRPAYDFDYVALDLLSVYPEDSGVYTCHARNAYGEAVSSATIKIFGKFYQVLINYLRKSTALDLSFFP